MINLKNMALEIVPSNNFIMNISNELPADVKGLVDIFNRSFSYKWHESKERTRALNKIWWNLFKRDQLDQSLTVNQYANTLPLQIDCDLKNVSMFFEQLEKGDRITPYLYAFVSQELKRPKNEKRPPKEWIFHLYLNKIVVVVLKKLLEYRISQCEFEQRIQGS